MDSTLQRTPMLGTEVPGGLPRRALLVMPVALYALVKLSSRSERPLPEPAVNGLGNEITLALFTDSGDSQGTVRVRRVIKTDDEWRELLNGAEFAVTRQRGTERAYSGNTWNEHRTGIYRCTCCATALFRSSDKFDSGTGWPSFSTPIADQNLTLAKDISLYLERVEVICAKCDAHLGHVFNDGPAPTGKRFCMNSAALRFKPAESV